MRRAWLAALLLLGPAAAAEGLLLLDATGSLLLGTAGAGVSARPEIGTPAVSHASHLLSWADCERELLVVFAYASEPPAPDARERALMQVEVRDAQGRVEGAWLAADGTLEAATAPLPPGAHALHVFHLVGGPASYEVVVSGHPAQCDDGEDPAA